MVKASFSFVLLLLILSMCFGSDLRTETQENTDRGADFYWVELVQVHLKGQAYPGFRVEIDINENEVKKALIAFYKQRGKEPVLSEEFISIAQVQLEGSANVDLFYKIEAKTAQHSMCTLVGIDQPAGHAFSGGYRPHTTRLLLQSWDNWIYAFSQKHIRFDHLIETRPDGLEAYQDTISILKAGIYAYESLMEEQEYLIDSLLRAVRRNPNRRKAVRIPLAKSNAELHVLRDSISSLKKRFRKSEQLLAQSNQRIDSLHNEIGIQKAFLTQLNQSQKQLDAALHHIEVLERQAEQPQEAKQGYTGEIGRLEGQLSEAEEAVSGSRRRLLSKLRKTENTLADVERRLTHARREVRKDQDYIFSLNEEKKLLQERLDTKRADTDSMQLRAREAEALALGLTRTNALMQREIDSLRTAYHNLSFEKRRLLARQDSLLTEIDLLGPYSQEARTRRRVYQEQLAILQDLERRLPAREQALSAREKRLEQREKYLAQTDRTGSYHRLTILLDSLTDANATLRSQLKGEESPTPTAAPLSREVYMSTLEIDEQIFPAFCIDREVNPATFQEGLIQYFRERMRLAPASRKPLSFQRVPLERQRMTLTFELGDQLSNGLRRIACSFRLANGEHLGPYSDEKAKKEAKSFLEALFP